MSDLITRHRLPTPLFNPRLYLNGTFLACPDAWWQEAGVAVEVDSKEWHFSTEESWQDTMRRHSRMTAAGILVIHVTPKQVRVEPGRSNRGASPGTSPPPWTAGGARRTSPRDRPPRDWKTTGRLAAYRQTLTRRPWDGRRVNGPFFAGA